MGTYFQKKFALTEQGMKDLKNGVILTVLNNLLFMLPIGGFLTAFMDMIYSYLTDSGLTIAIPMYIAFIAMILFLMFLINIVQYGAVFNRVYSESANRRMTLAEQLRKLPLAFFGTRDLTDLTKVIMGDCADLEHVFSHGMCQFIGSMISTVIAAAKAAQCENFIEKLPKGYQTIIGENGATLSGGERQRLSIARALLKDAPIVLLDEATSSLDVENESKVQEAIGNLTKNRTVIIIAHRMRTIADADRIIVLDKGAVAEQGTHEELLKRDGLYSHFAALNSQSAMWKLK